MDREPDPPPALLAHPPFALLWTSRVLSNVGFHMLGVAVGWQLYAITGNALDLGLVGLVQFGPMLLLTLVVGQVADRCDRRLVVAVCHAVKAGAAAILVAGATGHWQSRTSIFAVMALVGAVRAFEGPTTTALVPEVAPRTLIARAMALVVSANQTAQVAGPALGGFLYALGPGAAYGSACALFAVSCVLTALIQARRGERMREPLTLETLFSGLAFIAGRPVLLGSMSLDLFAVLIGGAATTLLPIFARDILDTGPGGLGLLRSAPAVGALVTSVVLARHPIERRVGSALFRAVVVYGAATVVFGLSRSFPLSLVALVVLGTSDVVSVVIRMSLVQLRTPDAMRGRVSAAHSLFTGTSNQLGAFEAGLVASLVGTVPAVLIGGLGTIAVAALWMLLFPALRRVRAFEE
jgi:MFS family permease